ncbi:MAG: aromatic ring-hydroxylating oxygenase subunit alpha, partial [Aeoliella sp.]
MSQLKTPAPHQRSATGDRLSALLRERQPWYSLPREFYKDHAVYEAELERIWKRGWLFVGHSCEISEPGQYVTFRVDNDSLIVVRGDEGQLQAFWNICRHRGTELCHQNSGKVGRFVCPYHQWTYTRDGELASCRGMQDELDKSQLGLLPAQAREVGGMVYASLSESPPDFDEAARTMGPLLKPQGLNAAKVAKTVDYEVCANWKTVWENNRECYHCNVNHPQYIKANFDHYNADDTSDRVQCRIDEVVSRSQSKWREHNLHVDHQRTGMVTFPDVERNLWFSANRTALVEGYV